MAELTINTADIAAAIQKNLDGFQPSLEQSQVGRVLEVGDGIARVSGLPGAAVNELLQFENGSFGLALNFDEGSIGAVVLEEGAHGVRALKGWVAGEQRVAKDAEAPHHRGLRKLCGQLRGTCGGLARLRHGDLGRDEGRARLRERHVRTLCHGRPGQLARTYHTH